MLPLTVDADFALRAASVIPSLTMAVFLAVVAAIAGAVTMRPAAISRHTERTAQNVGLALSDRLRPVVESRVRRRSLGAWIGAVAGAFAGVGLSALLPKDELVDGAPSIWLVLGGWVAGMGVSVMLTAVGSRGQIDPEAPRVARADAVDLADYVHPVERRGTRIVVALATAATIAALALALGGDLVEGGAAAITAPALLALGAVVSLIVFELGGRRIIARGRPATSPDELAWDDALRAQSVRDLLLGPVFTGGYAILTLGIALQEATSRTDVWWIGLAATLLSTVVALGVAVALVILPARRPQQHFLRRLWPEVAAEAERLADAAQYPVAGVDAASVRPESTR